MSPKEARRLAVMERALAGTVTIVQAASVLGLCERQVKRLKGGMLKEGIAFLAHKNRGLKPKHALSQQCRDEIISNALGDYRGASCEQMSELRRSARVFLFPPAPFAGCWFSPVSSMDSHKVARRRRPVTGCPRRACWFSAMPVRLTGWKIGSQNVAPRYYRRCHRQGPRSLPPDGGGHYRLHADAQADAHELWRSRQPLQ